MARESYHDIQLSLIQQSPPPLQQTVEVALPASITKMTCPSPVMKASQALAFIKIRHISPIFTVWQTPDTHPR